MAKKLLLALLFSFPHFLCSPVFASNGLRPPEICGFKAEACNAPAPDSFRITGISSNFISLAWHPVSTGVLHTLEVLEKNSAGGWDPLYTFYNVPGATYTVYNLQSGRHYRFIIATNCNSGEPSELKAIIDGIALILDLTIEGRTPILPQMAPCNAIPLNANWKGFKVSYLEGREVMENHFEFIDVSPPNTGSNFFTHVQIAREKLLDPIVAVNFNNLWPTCDDPSFTAKESFRIVRLINGGPSFVVIGWVDYIENSNPPSIKLCPDLDHLTEPWDILAYAFTPLVASNAISSPGCDRSEDTALDYSGIKVQSPFKENIRVFLAPSDEGFEKTTFRLLNTNGQIIMVHHLEISTSQVSFPVKALVAGIYILQIETEEAIQTIKIIKSE